MSHILVCAVPNPGHMGPMLAAAQHLKQVGHRVTFHTAETFRGQVEATGVGFVPMRGKANFDYRKPVVMDASLSQADVTARLVEMFAEVTPDQYDGIRAILKDTPVDLILIDTMLFGVFPLLMGPRENRPPIVACGVNPVMLSGSDCGYAAPPDESAEGQARIREEVQQFMRRFARGGELLDEILRSYGLPPTPEFYFDSMYRLPDMFLQFTAEALEYPRRNMPSTLRFIGPILPRRAAAFEAPEWWAELDSPQQPVVLVTQGTLANHDLNEVIQPALLGLAEEEVRVVVAVGRSDMPALTVPANARVAAFVPFDQILPKVDVLVTNGGYGAVNHALSLGVPVVVAGETEDKYMIAARVAWTGAGINLRTRYARPEQVREAVRSILTTDRYREEAKRLRRSYARYNALDELARTVDALVASRLRQPVYVH